MVAHAAIDNIVSDWRLFPFLSDSLGYAKLSSTVWIGITITNFAFVEFSQGLHSIPLAIIARKSAECAATLYCSRTMPQFHPASDGR